MNRYPVPRLSDYAIGRPVLVALLAAALMPGALLAQTADTAPPTAPAAPADQSNPSTTPPVAVTPGTDQSASPVKLNPFEVSADQAKGYFTPNTTSGTRLNNNIGDIPSSVTVIDRQQIEDTNSQNINDIMAFEAGAEGSRTFTPQTGFAEAGHRVDDALAGSNDVTGSIGGSETASTRINGLGAPDNEVDNFYGIYRIPFDTYNVQSVEIDRGPNSLMFGSGSPAGIVNASSSDAQINKFSGDISLQGSSFGGFRQTADLNVPLIRDHVALFMAEEYTAEGEQRKPSSNLTRRQYIDITIDPFKTHKTKITGYAEFYNNYANDENQLLPTDYVTPWLAAGKPVFNPINQMVTYLSTGKQIGPYVNSTTSPNYVAGNPTGSGALSSITSPLFVPGISGGTYAHFVQFYANGQFLYGFQPTQAIGSNYGGLIPSQVPTTPLTASQSLVRSEFMTASAQLPIPGVGAVGAPGGYSSYLQPSVVDPAIYNAQNGPNIDGTDYTQSKARTYHFDLQQNILPNLDLDIGYFRQEYHDNEQDPDNQHNTGNALYVDTNSYLLNGAPNAYVGSTYVEDFQGDGFYHPETNSNWRAMLSYSLDLRDKVPSWLKWLGHHRFLAEASTHDDVQQAIRLRTVIDGGDGSYFSELYQLNNQPAIPGNWNIQEAGSTGNTYRLQYLSSPGSYATTLPTSITGTPGNGSPENFTATTYNYTTGQWVTSALHQNSYAFNGYQITENVQDQKTYYWQSFFFNDRILGSFGLNDDVVKNRSGATIYNAIINGVPTATTNNAGLVSYVNGIENPALKYDLGPWNPTSTTGIYQPNTTQLAQSTLGEVGGNTYSEGFVIRPFENWSGIDAAANNGNIVAGFARTLGFTFNKADNFNPPTGTYTDLLGNPIGKPEGTEKDYGMEIATPDKKFYLRMTWFKSSNENNTGASYTSTGRELYTDQNEMKNWATTIVELNSGEDPTSTQFGNQSLYPLTTAQYAQMAALTGLNINYIQNGSGSPTTGGYFNPIATNTTTSGGYDLEITYNPLPNWTMKVTGGRQDGSISSVDSQAKAYQAVRMPVWLAAGAPQYPNVITNYLGKGSTSLAYVGNFWNSYGYDGNTGTTGGPGGGPRTVGDYYNGVVTVPITVEEAAQGSEVPEETEYTFQYLTNYNFVTGMLKGLGVGGDVKWMGSTLESYYGSQTLLNSAGQVAAYDLNNPIYYPAQIHADAWISYSFKLPWDDGKIRAKVQLNCTDLTSNGYLEPIAYNLDGIPNTYRIIPPRQWALTTTFSF